MYTPRHATLQEKTRMKRTPRVSGAGSRLDKLAQSRQEGGFREPQLKGHKAFSFIADSTV
ncbi:hypothetical protein HF325_001162 [Metschnikowia pulcherrima]|uniref:Uncharacterized protein n=1 Tax=Metschnikowia pulcherrima TaxID=27326 RepID=A0A8H7GU23_9ASCO|nr:hypothetical protein HF325_001162 [Metschnikowia pulcherrima]